jgi:pyruvate formate lyase activating enzyme
MKNVTGYIHSRESAGTLDGPGVRRVLFLQGCPLNCLYCHNPDARPFKCGYKTDAYTELREIARNKEYLIKTGGGVTLSGGEPLSQPEFVKTIFEGCKMMGIHTALDTSGYTGHRADDELLSYTDLVLLDIKHIRAADYKTLTCVKLQPTLEFARRLSDKNIPVWIRHVLVPGYTDNEEAVSELAAFVKTLQNVQRLEVLPYHKMADYKWQQLGIENKLADTPEPDEAMIFRTKANLQKSGVPVY